MLSPGSWIAPNATVIGEVDIGINSTVWYRAVIQGEAPKAQSICFHIVIKKFFSNLKRLIRRLWLDNLQVLVKVRQFTLELK